MWHFCLRCFRQISYIGDSPRILGVESEWNKGHGEVSIEEGPLHGCCCGQFGYGGEANFPECSNERQFSCITTEKELAKCESHLHNC